MFILIAENGSGADLYAGDAAEPGVQLPALRSFDSSEGAQSVCREMLEEKTGAAGGGDEEGLKERCFGP